MARPPGWRLETRSRPWHPSRAMEAATTAAACVGEAAREGAELLVYADRIRSQLQERAPHLSAERSEAHRVRNAAALRSTMEPLIKGVLRKAEATTRLIRLAVRLREALRFDEDLWQMALATLDTHRSLVEAACAPLRRLGRSSRLLREAWPTEWEERYGAALEDIGDLMETIALGLSAATRREIEERRQGLRAAG